MHPRSTTIGAGVVIVASLLLTVLTTAPGRADSEWPQPNWPQFRGPSGLANGDKDDPPTHFGQQTNIVWKTALPSGHSSPVIWGDKVFLTALDKGSLVTLCLDRRDGRILWRQAAPTEKLEPTHRIGSPAASTPVTDGRAIFVYFGSFGLLAYDFEGHELWRKPMPQPMVEFGAATSPILAAGLLILVCDQDQGSFLLAVDPRTGNQVWRTERPEFRRSFTSPFVWRYQNSLGLGLERNEELVVPGSIWLCAYDPRLGAELWRYSGTSRVANSTPTAGDGLLFSASWNIGSDPGDRITMDPFEPFAREHDADQDNRLTRNEIPAGPLRDRYSQMDLNKDGRVTSAEWETMREMFAKAGNAVLAIRPGGKGDITATHVAWKSTRSLPYVSSPVHFRGRLYTVKNGGLASCYEAKTGQVLYQDERLDAGGDYYASLVAAGGRIFAASQKGVVTVWEAGDKLAILSRNDLREEIMATPAIVDHRIYLRTAGHLFAFGR